MASIGFKKPNVGRVVAKLVGTVITLWVGGTVVTVLGNVMNCSQSPFYQGLNLIGWTIETHVPATSGSCNTTALAPLGTSVSHANQVTATSGSGVLAVIGIIGIASIIMEFVTVRY